MTTSTMILVLEPPMINPVAFTDYATIRLYYSSNVIYIFGIVHCMVSLDLSLYVT